MTVDVTESEYSISMPQTELPPGMYTVAVSNTGQTGHDLVINGPGVDEQRTPVLDGGASDQLMVTLQEGTYELWCSVGDHRAQGMDLQLEVTASAPPPE